MSKTYGAVVLALLAGLAWTAPAGAAVTLTDGRVVPGLEPTPGESVSRPEAPDADASADQWFWYRVAAEGLEPPAPQPTALALADLAEVLASEFAPPADDARVPAAEVEAVIQTSGAGAYMGPAHDRRPLDTTDWMDWDDPSRLGMRVGRADGEPVAPHVPALSFLGGGMTLGLVVRRRRT